MVRFEDNFSYLLLDPGVFGVLAERENVLFKIFSVSGGAYEAKDNESIRQPGIYGV